MRVLPANQHFTSPNLGRGKLSFGPCGILSSTAANVVIINGTPHEYTLYIRSLTSSCPFSIDVGRKSLQIEQMKKKIN